MIIEFPRNYKVDLNNIPDDFERQIKKCFGEYTEGTSKNYTYQDKLMFLDVMARKLHKANDSYDAVKAVMWERFEYELDERGDIPDKKDYNCIEFMQRCYEKGLNDSSFYTHITKDHRIYDKIMELEYRAIKAVMEWEHEQ